MRLEYQVQKLVDSSPLLRQASNDHKETRGNVMRPKNTSSAAKMIQRTPIALDWHRHANIASTIFAPPYLQQFNSSIIASVRGVENTRYCGWEGIDKEKQPAGSRGTPGMLKIGWPHMPNNYRCGGLTLALLGIVPRTTHIFPWTIVSNGSAGGFLWVRLMHNFE